MDGFRTPGLIAVTAAAAWFIYYRAEEARAGCCWPETAISSFVVFLLVFPLVMSLLGRWRPFAGAIPAALITFALTAPATCSHSIADGISGSFQSMDCESISGLRFPSYYSEGSDTEAPIWPAALIGVAGGSGIYLIARQRYQNHHS